MMEDSKGSKIYKEMLRCYNVYAVTDGCTKTQPNSV